MRTLSLIAAVICCALASCAANVPVDVGAVVDSGLDADTAAAFDVGAASDTPLGCDATPDDVFRACSFRRFTSATCSPDGEGWCCPLLGTSCDCSATGGFETDPCRCGAHYICDLAPPAWGTRIDEHGCPTLEMRPTTACCLCFGSDAGSSGNAGDAGSPEDARDAGSPGDAGVDAP